MSDSLIEGSEMSEQCVDCRFFKFADRWENSIGGLDDIGKCRRYPPTELQGDGAEHPYAVTHSFVVGDDWCGEFVSAKPSGSE